MKLQEVYPKEYFKTISCLFLISWSMMFPDWFATWFVGVVVDSLEFMIGADTVHFAKDLYMPRITKALKHV